MKQFRSACVAILLSLSLVLAQFIHVAFLDALSPHEASGQTVLQSQHSGADHGNADHDHGLDTIHSALHAHADVTVSITPEAQTDFDGKVARTAIMGILPAGRGLAPPVPPPLV